MDPIPHIDQLGWDWRSDGAGLGLGPGVVLSVAINGRVLRAFVPLSRIWLAFHDELEKVGCSVGDAWVGEPFSVGGFFSFVKKATNSLGSAARSVVPKAIQDAASNVYSTAQHFGEQALHQVSKVPVLGTVATAAESLASLPAHAVSQLVEGKRIDHIAVDQFKSALGSVRAIAPYAQTVVSFVPGIGQGISAGLGGALALAQGQSINEAMLTAIKDAIPGGPVAQAAFAVASGALQGKPIDQIALHALPIDAEAKKVLAVGLSSAKALASGQNVSHVAIDAALHQLPPELQKAVQIGVAVGHAKNLQEAATAAAHGAQQLAGHYAAGQAAAQLFARGVRSPEVVSAMQKAHLAHAATATIVQHAQAGHPQARNIVNAMNLLRRPQPQAVDDIVKALGRVGPSAFHHHFA